MKFLLIILALCVVANSNVVSNGFLNHVVDLDRRQMQASSECMDALSDHYILAPIYGAKSSDGSYIVMDTYWD